MHLIELKNKFMEYIPQLYNFSYFLIIYLSFEDVRESRKEAISYFSYETAIS